MTVKPARKKGGGGDASSSSGSCAVKSLAKPVVNCLSCGKVRGGGQARRAWAAVAAARAVFRNVDAGLLAEAADPHASCFYHVELSD